MNILNKYETLWRTTTEYNFGHYFILMTCSQGCIIQKVAAGSQPQAGFQIISQDFMLVKADSQ